MSRRPTYAQNIIDLRNVQHKPQPSAVCTHPECDETRNLTGHHIARRSHMVGAVDWVGIDGYVVCNVARLCRVHHDEIENNADRWIRWTGDCFEWLVREDGDWWGLGMLEPHPEIL